MTHAGSKRVLVTAPNPSKLGGVASYWRALIVPLSNEVIVTTVGARDGSTAGLRTAVRVLTDTLRFTSRVGSSDIDMVQLNPSLDSRSLVRDGLLLLAAKMRRRKVVVMFHGWDRPTEECLTERWAWVFRWVFARADAVVVLASEFRDRLRNWGLTIPVHVATTAIDPECERAAMRTRSNSARLQRSEPVRLLYLGRVVRQKGVMECAEALAIARHRLPQASLAIAGSGEADDALRVWQRLHPYEPLRLLGQVRGPEKSDVLAQSDVLLCPTRHGEGMPIALLEGLTFGLIPVAPPVAGIADLVQHGVPVVALRDTTAQSVADAVIGLCEDRATWLRMSSDGARIALRTFCSATVAAHLKEIYRMTRAGDQRCLDWWDFAPVAALSDSAVAGEVPGEA